MLFHNFGKPLNQIPMKLQKILHNKYFVTSFQAEPQQRPQKIECDHNLMSACHESDHHLHHKL